MHGSQRQGAHIGMLNSFFQSIRQQRWDDSLPATAMFFPEDQPKRAERPPRALAEHVMAQVENTGNLDRWGNPAYRLVTLVLIHCGLRISDALRVDRDCVVADADGAPYLRYFNHKMKREALVPIGEDLHRLIGEQQQLVLERWPAGPPGLFPRPAKNVDGQAPTSSSTYRLALYRWLERCDIQDEHGRPVHFTPHQWRHTLGTRMINRDVPQEVVRRILDHDSSEMTAHYARLHDTTVRRHWEQARKVNIAGETVTLDPGGPLAEAAWARQRLGRVTQALPNGYCGLPVQKTCPHANACLTCPMFVTTTQFLPQHRDHRQQLVQIISAAQARGQSRLAEMNQQVLANLDTIITSLQDDTGTRRQPPMPADNTAHLAIAARRRHELTRAKAIRALHELARAGTPVSFELVARTAGVSRSWLYSQPDIRTEIQQLRDATQRTSSPPVPAAQRASGTSLHRRLQAASERNRQLTEDNKRLRHQLAEALGQLRAPGNPRSSVTIRTF